jgi:hypothetical protein
VRGVWKGAYDGHEALEDESSKLVTVTTNSGRIQSPVVRLPRRPEVEAGGAAYPPSTRKQGSA